MHCSTFFAKAKRVFDVQKTAESKVSALLYTFHFEYLALLSSECAGTLNISVRSGCEAERSVFGQKNVSNHSNVFFSFSERNTSNCFPTAVQTNSDRNAN